jgi:hypothetical protein
MGGSCKGRWLLLKLESVFSVKDEGMVEDHADEKTKSPEQHVLNKSTIESEIINNNSVFN